MRAIPLLEHSSGQWKDCRLRAVWALLDRDGEREASSMMQHGTPLLFAEIVEVFESV